MIFTVSCFCSYVLNQYILNITLKLAFYLINQMITNMQIKIIAGKVKNSPILKENGPTFNSKVWLVPILCLRKSLYIKPRSLSYLYLVTHPLTCCPSWLTQRYSRTE